MFCMLNDKLLLIAGAFTRQSAYGIETDPSLALSDVMAFASVPRDYALSALRVLAQERSISVQLPSPNPGGEAEVESTIYLAEPQVFVKYDKATVGNDPHADARLLQEKIPSDQGTSLSVQEFIRENGWSVRRVNPAISILLSSGHFEGGEAFIGDRLLRHSLSYRGRF
jgi:hypothetical protein